MKVVLCKNLSFLLLLAYTYIALFGLVTIADHHHSPMTNCPYMIGQSLCSMGVFEHLGAWKTSLLSIPVDMFVFLIFGFVVAFIVIQISSSPPLLRQLLYYKKLKVVPIISDLQLQFSQGLLNPKPY